MSDVCQSRRESTVTRGDSRSFLPVSRRDRWFEELEKREVDPWGGEVPAEYKAAQAHLSDHVDLAVGC
jgi:hypothetical protein